MFRNAKNFWLPVEEHRLIVDSQTNGASPERTGCTHCLNSLRMFGGGVPELDSVNDEDDTTPDNGFV